MTRHLISLRRGLSELARSAVVSIPLPLAQLLGRLLPVVARSSKGALLAPQVLRNLVHLWMGRGSEAQARAVLGRTADPSSPALIQATHALAVTFGWDDIAARAERSAGWLDHGGASLSVILSCERLVANGMPDAACRELDQVRDLGSLRWVNARRGAAWEAGCVREALELARRSVDLGDRIGRLVEFDALWALGDAEAAQSAVATYLSEEGLDSAAIPRVLSLRALQSDPSALYLWVCSTSGSDSVARTKDLALASVLAELAFQLGLRDTSDQVLSAARSAHPSSPDVRFLTARSAYVQRRFDDALRCMDDLALTRRSRDADKLAARIAFELGDANGAEQARLKVIEPRGATDEVLLYARLALGKYDEAFRDYLARGASLRLASGFAGVAVGSGGLLAPANEGPSKRPAVSIFVVTQDGPGDEIIGASLFGDLRQRYTHVAASCDPRLASLLRRSFPEIEFVACQRQSSRPILGLNGPDQPPRARGSMHPELTRAAAAAAASTDHVCFSRSLWSLRDSPRPVAPYLRPDPERVARWRRVVPDHAVGIVWRSEYSNPMRDIHFVRVEDLAPLARLGRPTVCLQHDTTEAEREVLQHLFGNVMFVADTVDLRDDFEGTAALVATLDGVVGPGTTVVELSAAVGTRTVCLQPNNFGKWRSIGSGDFWHQTMSHACATDPRRPAECVSAAAKLLQAVAHGDCRGSAT